jgi:hypothetical protein
MAATSKRLVVAEFTQESRFVLASPLVGYKFVTASYGPPVRLNAADRFAVGSRHKLAAAPAVGRWGYHFVTNPLMALETMAWKPTYRLVRIEVPAGATVATNGVTYATSELRVVADETASTAAMLTGVVRFVSYNVVEHISYVAGEVGAPPDSDEPFHVEVTADGRYRRKDWHGSGGKKESVYAYQSGDADVDIYRHESSGVSRDVWEARFRAKEWYETVAV